MLSRKAIGVSLSSSGVSFARLLGPSSAPGLERMSRKAFPAGVLRFSTRDKNIHNTALFRETLREACNALLCPARRVFLSLPDNVGRVLILDVEERFRSRSEALDILRWKLKKKIPCESPDLHLDYQQLAVRDNGARVVMAVMVSRAVIEQYEEIFAAAEIIPARIDLDCFNLCRLFEKRLAVCGDFALVSHFASSLGMMFFSKGILEFVRLRDVTGSKEPCATFHKEIKCTMLAYRERFHNQDMHNVFYVAPPAEADEFRNIVRDASGCEPVQLETRAAIAIPENIRSDQESLFFSSAAIGAALQGL